MAECWDAVQVFMLCTWECVAIVGMKEARLHWTRIAAAEIEAVARSLAVPFTAELLTQVRQMETAAGPLRNAK